MVYYVKEDDIVFTILKKYKFYFLNVLYITK